MHVAKTIYILRLQNTTRNSPIKQASLRKTCCSSFFYPIMWLLLFISFLLGNILWIMGALRNISWNNISYDLIADYMPYEYQRSYALFGAISALLDIIIHITIITAYIHGLFAMSRSWFSKEYWDRYKANNDKIHEQMIEASRYTVLFGLHVTIVFTLGMVMLWAQIKMIENNAFKVEMSYYMYDIVMGYLMIRDMSSLIVMFLSFQFSHRWYENKYLCGSCDKIMKRYWENKAKEIDLIMDNSDGRCGCCYGSNYIIVQEYDDKGVPLLDRKTFDDSDL